MALVLALETSTRLCSVALGRDALLLSERNEDGEGFIHAERLHVLVAAVIQEAGCSFGQLDAIAVGIGPGSYTGLRIGLSAAKGFAHALDKPLLGVCTLDILVAALLSESGVVVRDRIVCPMIDARRMEVFTAAYSAQGRPSSAPHPQVLDAEWAARQVPGTVVCGDGADKAAALWSESPALVHVSGVRPWARALLPLAVQRLAAGDVDDTAYLVPIYGKEAGVTLPRPSGPGTGPLS